MTHDDAYADLLSHDTFTEGVPYATFARLRKDDPVYWTDETDGPGCWHLTRYADIMEVSKRTDLFTSREGIRLEDMADDEKEARRTLMEEDPPRHTRIRRLVNRGFTRRAVDRYREPIAKLATRVVDTALERDQFDFVEHVAKPLPMMMLAILMGVPEEDAAWLVEKGDQLLGNTDPEFTDHVVDQVDTDDFRLLPFRSPASLELFDYAERLAEDRRKAPREDIITQLLNADGADLSNREFMNFFALLVAAGNDTTRYSMAASLKLIIEKPSLIETLRNADDALWSTATDEFLRLTSVTMHFRRTAKQDLNLGGRDIASGDKVLLWYCSGNRDESQFERADELDITRDPNPHMAFGRGGPHVCLGAWLARLEIRLALQIFLSRVRSVEQVDEERYLRSNFISGIKELQVKVERL